MTKLVYTKNYIKRAKKFAKQHPELLNQYAKTLQLLELNPFHPSLRLRKLKGHLSDCYSVSINISYRITLSFMIQNDVIIPIDVGQHDDVY